MAHVHRTVALGILGGLLAVFPVVSAQTTTANLSGVVTDPAGAVIPGASVELTNVATNQTFTAVTTDAGVYIFAGVPPGNYRLSVMMPGFMTATSAVRLEVASSQSLNVRLRVGEVAETVEVVATGVHLRTLDATVGTVVGGQELQRLPTIDRSAASLILLQPLVVGGGRAVNDYQGGQVAGSRSDQQTFMLDGGDATNDTEASGGYSFSGTPDSFVGFGRPAIPVPVESIEEFRVTTSNADATFGRAGGGAINLVTKRGTNNIHGSAYWYHQNDNLNANTWDRNRVGVANPELKDNRYGGSLGGPIFRDRTFVYGHFEGRRFPQSNTVTRIVPTDSMKAGILRFRDGEGVVQDYNLATAICAGGGTCDPRGLGISPAMSQFFGLYPAGNDTSLGDGLNTIGFRTTAAQNLVQDFAVIRLDQKVTDLWNLFGSYRYHRHIQPGINQVDIRGGQAVPAANNLIQPRYAVLGLDGPISSSLTAQFRGSFTRNWWEWQRTSPSSLLTGVPAALDVGGDAVNTTGNFLSEPLNVDTQQARSRVWNGRDWFVSGNFAWLKGAHTFQFGTTYRRWNIFHRRNDKVLGAVDALIYFSRPDTVSIADVHRPPLCPSNTSGSNCLRPGDQSIWDMQYVNALGIIDRATILLTRDGVNLDPLPFGTPLTADVKVDAWEGFFQDTWRIRPSLTLTAGVNYAVQVPPMEKEGKQMVLVYSDNRQPVVVRDHFDQILRAAERGEVFNPAFSWVPIQQSPRKRIYDIDWGTIGPRVAMAWNPSASEGFWGRFLGEGKTVIRGGYSKIYDRNNGVGLVMTPLLGVGLGEILQCLAPDVNGVCTTTGASPANAFRLGVDGNTVPMPAPSPGTIPFTVGLGGESSSRLVDPGRKTGFNHAFNLTWQREIRNDIVLELGYVGKIARGLVHNIDMNSVPLNFHDPISGQTFAQAFDAVATHLRGGGSAETVPAQPWFENWIVSTAPALAGGAPNCAGLPAGSCTAQMATLWGTDFRNGHINSVAITRMSLNSLFPHPLGFVNAQSTTNQLTSSTGRSWYNAGFLSVQKRMSGGLSYGVNYTFAKSLDDWGINQQYVNSPPNSLFLDIGRGPSMFDRTHSLNVYGLYELPFGRGRRWAPDSTAVDKILGGWNFSWIFNAMSGLPLCVTHGGTWGGAGGTFQTACAMGPKMTLSRNDGVSGSEGIGTSGTVNGFSNPEAVFGQFRHQLYSQETRTGRGLIRGQKRWDLDMSLGKRTTISESVSIGFNIDFLNIFNHVELNDPGMALTSPATFGVITSQFNQPRTIQMGLRVDF